MAVYDIHGNPISDPLNEGIIAGGILTPNTVLNGFIYGGEDYHFVENDYNRCLVYEIVPGETYIVKSETIRKRYTFACFRTIPVNNSIPVYCELHYGENEFIVTVPNNSTIKYAVLWCYSQQFDGDDPDIVFDQVTIAGKASTTLPQTANYLDDVLMSNAEEQYAVKEEFTLCAWNIGHFAMGVHRNTDITASDYVEKLKAFNDMVLLRKADIFAVSEYSRIFANLGTDNSVNADDVIFGEFENKFIGEQRNFSCDAVFGNIHVRDIRQVDYECNQDAEITHTTLIKATDYYYVRWNMVVNGRDVLCIATHLAFDTNKPDVLQQAQIEELISVCENAPYVIILADFNTSNFDAFKTAGYAMIANSGVNNGYIDNIVVKGLEIIEGISISGSNSLSDHKMVMCKIRIPIAS